MKHYTGHFLSGDTPVRVEHIWEETGCPLPAVLVIHGASALPDRVDYMLHISSALASQGLASCFVHYFDRTGHIHATDEEMFTHFFTWLGTLREAVSCMAEQPHVDASRLACFGFSLGGYLALALAGQEERLGAVVELAGGIDPSYVEHISRLPPTLILHGDQDTRVPVTNARFLEELFSRLGIKHETHLYPGESHVLALPALVDAIERSAKFIHRHLA